jgi:hypothetical protein
MSEKRSSESYCSLLAVQGDNGSSKHSYTEFKDESRKGSLRVHSLAEFVHGLFDDSLGVRAPAILIQNRLNQRRIPKG